MRITIFCRDSLQPARLARRVGRIPQRLLMHGLDDVQPTRVTQVVRWQVVALERCVIAVTEVHGVGIAQPGIIVARQIPEMLVRIDNGEVVFGWFQSRALRSWFSSWPGLSRPSGSLSKLSKTWMPGTRPGMT